MDELNKLRNLSIVSKVCTELENHLGVNDKTLAEFLIDLAKKHRTLSLFRSAVTEVSGGDPLPDSLTASIYKCVPHDGELQNKTTRTLPLEVSASKGGRGTSLLLNKDEGSMHTMAADEGNFLGSGIDRQKVIQSSDIENNAIHSSRHDGNISRSLDDLKPSLSPRVIHNAVRSDVKPGAIICGRVRNVRDYGVFVSLTSGRPEFEGLVHISQIPTFSHQAPHLSDVIKRGQNVFVKVLSVSKDRISLSMRNIDQSTGFELSLGFKNDSVTSNGTHCKTGAYQSPQMSGRRPKSENASVSGIPSAFVDDGRDRNGRLKRNLPESDQWELNQLSKILSRKELSKHFGTFTGEPPLGKVCTQLSSDEFLIGEEGESLEEAEEAEIELNEDEPEFLQSSSSFSGVSRAQPLSPVRIVKNPDGVLQRAAMTQSVLAKERREERDQQRAALESEMPSDLNLAWEDPMSRERYVAAELRGSAAGPLEVPEWKKSTIGAAPSFGFSKIVDKTIAEQRKSLPIFKLKDELLSAISANQVLIVVGETGSGKSTQMTQYLLEAGYTTNKRIGCTQPRRVAAISVAKRVAEERGCRLGEEVGYSIRFEDCTSSDTKIKYMTDGMLLREVLTDRNLEQYSVIMLDEAHERTIATDVLFGLLKEGVTKRRDLKVIVTSATLDAEKFSSYFFNCDIFTIPGRLFPVEVFFAKEPVVDYLEESLNTVMRIHFTEPAGDILLFLTGQEEIDTAAEILYNRMKRLGNKVPELIILPVYSALPSEMQTRIFDPAPLGSRKVVIATNIAEASLTIDGIYYVVDPGFAKQKVYNPKLGMDCLVVAPISQASSRQRKGRAGRTGPGKCFCLYTENAYMNEMLPTTVPELQRSNLSHTVLTLKAMGINDLLNFDFMDPPPTPYLISAMERLYSLGALDEEGLLTKLGRMMSQFPLDPMLSKMLLASVDLGCSEEILTIVSMLGVQSIFYRPKEKQGQADQKKSKFHQPEGDHLTLLTVYNSWQRNRFSNAWCYDNFVQARSLKRAQDVRKQLVMIMDRFGLNIMTAGTNYIKIRKAIVSGFFVHAAKKDPQEGYRTLVDGQQVFIHPSSSLFHAQPEWVIYHEVVLTTKEYMREVMAIESKWLVELAPRFFRAGDPTKLSRRKKREKIEPLYDKYAQNPDDWRLSRRRRV